MSIVEIRSLGKSYGNKAVLRDINFAVESGEFMVVYGLPVSGKSVLVRLIAGLEKPDAGVITMRGREVTHLPAGDRNIGYVPQSFALYPHFSVYDNIGYSLNLARVPKADVRREVQRAAELLKIEQFLDRKPDQLSGGQKQRVAIARGLVKQTDVFILDDPLVGLDFKLRERLIDDLKQTQEMLKVTFVYTTSEAIEAMMLGTNIAVMDGGKIVEAGPPEQLYNAPKRAQTMRYVGFPQANILAATLSGSGDAATVTTPLFKTAVAPLDEAGLRALAGAKKVEVGIRPEHIQFGAEPGALGFQAKLLLREDLGGEEIGYLEASGVQLATALRGDAAAELPYEIDHMVDVSVRPANILVFADDQLVGRGKSA